MKKFSIVGLILILTSCASFPSGTSVLNYGNGIEMEIKQLGCLLTLTFRNNSSNTITLLGGISVVSKKD